MGALTGNQEGAKYRAVDQRRPPIIDDCKSIL